MLSDEVEQAGEKEEAGDDETAGLPRIEREVVVSLKSGGASVLLLIVRLDSACCCCMDTADEKSPLGDGDVRKSNKGKPDVDPVAPYYHRSLAFNPFPSIFTYPAIWFAQSRPSTSIHCSNSSLADLLPAHQDSHLSLLWSCPTRISL